MRSTVIVVLLALGFISGCHSGPRVVAVQGFVTRGGQPFKAPLLLTFYPESEGQPSKGLTDAEGHFELKFDRHTKGAAVGKHKVVVAFRPANAGEEAEFAAGRHRFHPDQEQILEKYGSAETTQLSVEISGAKNDLEIKLD